MRLTFPKSPKVFVKYADIYDIRKNKRSYKIKKTKGANVKKLSKESRGKPN